MLTAGVLSGRREDPWQTRRGPAEEAVDGIHHQPGPAQRRDPELCVGRGPQRIVDLGDDLAGRQLLHGELGGHDVPVVALGQGQEQVGVLGPGTAQHVLIRAVAPHGVAGERAGQAVECPRRDVQDDHLVAGLVEHLGHRGAHPAAADDDRFHVGSSVMGSRTTHTAHGAFFSTYGIVRPIAKSPPKRFR